MTDQQHQASPAPLSVTGSAGAKTVSGPVRPGTAPMTESNDHILSPLGQEQRRNCAWLPCPSAWS